MPGGAHYLDKSRDGEDVNDVRALVALRRLADCRMLEAILKKISLSKGDLQALVRFRTRSCCPLLVLEHYRCEPQRIEIFRIDRPCQPVAGSGLRSLRSCSDRSTYHLPRHSSMTHDPSTRMEWKESRKNATLTLITDFDFERVHAR